MEVFEQGSFGLGVWFLARFTWEAIRFQFSRVDNIVLFGIERITLERWFTFTDDLPLYFVPTLQWFLSSFPTLPLLCQLVNIRNYCTHHRKTRIVFSVLSLNMGTSSSITDSAWCSSMLHISCNIHILYQKMVCWE